MSGIEISGGDLCDRQSPSVGVRMMFAMQLPLLLREDSHGRRAFVPLAAHGGTAGGKSGKRGQVLRLPNVFHAVRVI